MQDQPSLMSYAVPIAIVVLVMALRWRRMSRSRPLRIGTLWILPSVYAVAIAMVFAAAPPTLAGWGWSALALAAGGAVGWQRGRLMHIEIDPATGALSQRASPAAMLVLIALIVARNAARVEIGGPAAAGHGVRLLTDVAMAFGLGLVVATRLEMWIRARRMLRGAAG